MSLCLLLPATTHAEQFDKGVFGLGLIVGEPTGVTGKLYLGDRFAVDFGVGSAFIGGGIHIHGDVLWHPYLITGSHEAESSFVMPLYVGVGGRILRHDRGRDNDDDFHVGVRGVVGVAFDFHRNPLDVFLEIAAVAERVSGGGDIKHEGFGLALNAGAGVRYYF